MGPLFSNRDSLKRELNCTTEAVRPLLTIKFFRNPFLLHEKIMYNITMDPGTSGQFVTRTPGGSDA
jgi:hypothetical protein